MKLPRNLSGESLAAALCRSWSYERIHQSGSHIILQTETPKRHRVAVPNHVTLRIGTLNGILRNVASVKGVDRGAILASIR